MKSFLLILLLFPGLVYGAELSREMPNSITSGEAITVRLTLEDIAQGERVVLGEFLPNGAVLMGWESEGAMNVVFEREDQALAWEFTADSTSPSIIYQVRLPEQEGELIFEAVYALPPDKYGAGESKIVLLPIPPVTPQLEAPAPLTSTKYPFVLESLIIICALAAMGLYLRTRFTQYNPGHTSFVDQSGRILKTVLTVFGYRSGLLIPEPTSPYEVFERFPETQDRMITELEAVSNELPERSLEHMELDELKAELKSIRFIFA